LQEEVTLKYSYLGIIVVLIVVAAMVSGCTSGPAASPTPTAKPAGNATTGPTAVPGVARSGSLFDTGKLQWFEYRLTTHGEDGKASLSDLRFDYTTATVNGVTVKDDRITMKLTDPNMILTMDTYYDQATDRQVGGHMKMISDDITLTDQDVAAADDQYRSSDIAGTFATSDWPLASQGTESVTIDGKTYTCTKYSVGNDGEYGTAWMAQGVPVPVEIESKSVDAPASTWELVGWG
jgi:hypothetical protein